MRKFIITLHRWIGVPVGLLFIITFSTGLLTAIDELASRAHYSQYQFSKSTLNEQANAIRQITADNKNIRQLNMPTEKTPYYQVVIQGQRLTYAINDLNQSERETQESQGFFPTVLQLHRNLLINKLEQSTLFDIKGNIYVAWVGLSALLLSFLGFWMWWSRRRTFSIKDIIPRSSKPKHLYLNHMSAGVVTFIAIFMLVITGASISYRHITKQILNIEEQNDSAFEMKLVAKNWHAWLTAAYAEFPKGELVQIRFPRPDKNKTDEKHLIEKVEFRFLTTTDWLGLPSNKVYLDKNHSTIIGVSSFSSKALGEKVYATLVPLHTGRDLHFSYLLILMLFSLLGIVMVGSGLLSFFKKQQRKFLRKKHVLAVTYTVV